jgi:hypothetical protein
MPGSQNQKGFVPTSDVSSPPAGVLNAAYAAEHAMISDRQHLAGN